MFMLLLLMFLLYTLVAFSSSPPPSFAFINFTQFSFSPTNSTITQILHFPLPSDDENSHLNISLSTGPDSGIVVAGKCRNKTLQYSHFSILAIHLAIAQQGSNHSGKVSALICSSNASMEFASPSPILFATSLDFKFTIVQPNKLPTGKCHHQNASNKNLLQLGINSLVPTGGQGTLAIRLIQSNNEKEIKMTMMDGRIEELEENEMELLFGGNSSTIANPLLLMLNGPVSSEFGEMESFQLDLAIRRIPNATPIQLELVQKCPNSNGSTNSFALGQFIVGQFASTISGTSEPYELGFNIFIFDNNGTKSTMFLYCPQPLVVDIDSEDENEKEDDIPPPIMQLLNSSQPPFPVPTGPIILFINVVGVFPQNGSKHSSPSSAILAFSLLRTFRPILVQNAEQQSEDELKGTKGGWLDIVLFTIFMPLLLLGILAGCAIFANQSLLKRKMMDCENQRRQAIDQQLGFFEINLHNRHGTYSNRGVANISLGSQRRKIAPTKLKGANTNTTNIDMVALSRNALGSGRGGEIGWI